MVVPAFLGTMHGVAADPASRTGGDEVHPVPALAGRWARLAGDESPTFVYDGFKPYALTSAWKSWLVRCVLRHLAIRDRRGSHLMCSQVQRASLPLDSGDLALDR